MVDIFFTVIWLGGMGVAYRRNRILAGRGVFASALEASAWPWNLGRFIAFAFYAPDAKS